MPQLGPRQKARVKAVKERRGIDSAMHLETLMTRQADRRSAIAASRKNCSTGAAELPAVGA
jgi:hypothetical protein